MIVTIINPMLLQAEDGDCDGVLTDYDCDDFDQLIGSSDYDTDCDGVYDVQLYLPGFIIHVNLTIWLYTVLGADSVRSS